MSEPSSPQDSIPENFLRSDHLLGQKLYELFANEVESSDQLSAFLRVLYGQSKKEKVSVKLLAENFIQQVNESAAFGLRAWTEAVVILYEQCIAGQQQVPWKNALGYLHCCAEAGGATEEKLNDDLAQLTSSFYQKYGIIVE